MYENGHGKFIELTYLQEGDYWSLVHVLASRSIFHDIKLKSILTTPGEILLLALHSPDKPPTSEQIANAESNLHTLQVLTIRRTLNKIKQSGGSFAQSEDDQGRLVVKFQITETRPARIAHSSDLV